MVLQEEGLVLQQWPLPVLREVPLPWRPRECCCLLDLQKPAVSFPKATTLIIASNIFQGHRDLPIAVLQASRGLQFGACGVV